MKTFFRILARSLAALFAILFVIALPVVLLLVNIERQFLESGIYKQALNREEIYAKLPALMGQTLAQGMTLNPCENNPIACQSEARSPALQACLEAALDPAVYTELAQNERIPTEAEIAQAAPCFEQFGWPEATAEGGPPAFLKNLTAGDWEMILRSLLPPEDMQQMAELTLDSLFAYLNGQAESAAIPLTTLKTRLAGPEGLGIVETLIEAQPPCTLDQLAVMTSTLAETGEIIFCNPGEEMLITLQPLFQEQLIQVSAGIPDEAVLIEPSPITEGDPRQGIQMARTIMRLSLLLPLVLLLGITIFAVRDLRSWLGWWGIPILVAGAISLAASLSLTGLYGFFITRYAVPEVPPHIPMELARMGFDLGQEVLRLLSQRLALLSALIGLTGGGMLVGAMFTAKKPPAWEN
ncbi:MAG: hypothetical protein ACOYY3_00430 [Chloroflexota bacterium]